MIAFALAYMAVDYLKVPRPIYEPLAREWRFGARPRGMSMGYFGQWGWSWAAAALIFGGVWLALGLRRKPLGERLLGLGLAWTLTAVALVLAYFAWMNRP